MVAFSVALCFVSGLWVRALCPRVHRSFVPYEDKISAIPGPVNILEDQDDTRGFVRRHVVEGGCHLVILHCPLCSNNATARRAVAFYGILALARVTSVNGGEDTRRCLRFQVNLREAIGRKAMALLPSFGVGELFFIAL